MRTDWLLALALAYERNTAQNPIPPDELFALLPDEARQRLERRRQEICADDEAKVTGWLGQTLDDLRQRVRQKRLALDARIHPSHIAAVLRDEPTYIQRLLLASLPAPMGAAVARALRQSQARLSSDDLAPVAAALNAVRQRLLGQFISPDQIAPLTAFDELTEAELQRTAQAAGIAELGLAGYDLPTTEAVTALLRRFSEADARAVAARIAALRAQPAPAAARREFARRIVQSALTHHKRDPELAATLGWQVIAAALPAGCDANRLAFTFQKLTPKLARRLQEWLDAPPAAARPALQAQLFQEILGLAQRHRNEAVSDLPARASALE
ncbi:MAG: hypothetical protein CFK52_08460 [Chloracidobacterium sp. CP2_5A]|nr:MAG: hypothetical protein CFK52_08460 [Chloracidobacterium sp. CP2_5A]